MSEPEKIWPPVFSDEIITHNVGPSAVTVTNPSTV